jgi:hypothetical protein
MHLRTAERMVRAAWTMWRDERTLGTIMAVVVVGVVILVYAAERAGEEPETSRNRGDTAR